MPDDFWFFTEVASTLITGVNVNLSLLFALWLSFNELTRLSWAKPDVTLKKRPVANNSDLIDFLIICVKKISFRMSYNKSAQN